MRSASCTAVSFSALRQAGDRGPHPGGQPQLPRPGAIVNVRHYDSLPHPLAFAEHPGVTVPY